MTVPILMVPILLTGCMNEGASKLVGTWSMQALETLEQAERSRAGGPAGQAENVRENTAILLDGVADGDSRGSMTLVFQRNGQLQTVSDFPNLQSDKTWTWQTVEWDAANSVLKIRCQRQLESVETAIAFIDENTIQLIPPNIDGLGTELRFVRKPRSSPES